MADKRQPFTNSQSRRSAKRNARTARSLSRFRPDFITIRPDRSSSRSTDVSEKILNTDMNGNDSDMFFEVCDTFEKLLKDLDLTENSHRIQDKLTKIGDLIQKKISFVKNSKGKVRLNSASLSANDLSLSIQSLLSENSYDSGHNSTYEKFMKRVNCPFCSKIQGDKIRFVKHLDRSCSAHLKKTFKKEVQFPYATFQILPNNLIKCNVCHNQVQQDLRHFYDHANSVVHKQYYQSAAKVKNYVDRLFCACCKTMVYNNYTQIKSHIDQAAHKNKCEGKRTTADYLNNGIHFLFTESGKFKCLDCPAANSVCKCPKSALQHLDDPQHKKHKKKNTFYSQTLHCELCSVQVQLYEIITHFSSKQHLANERILKEESFEVCFCCNFFCKSMVELSHHMESECVEINSMRQYIQKKDPDPKRSPKCQTEEEGNLTIGTSITVKNCTKIPALFRYFTQFGEIVTIEPNNDKDVVIEFREKSAVEDVLMLQDVIVMDGTKLEIETGLNSVKSGEKTKPETESESEASESSSKSEDDADLENGDPGTQDGRLDELFARVSNYLMNTAQKLNAHDKVIIQDDCVLTLKLKKCHLLGFSGCELSFPSEFVTLFCGALRNSPNMDDNIVLSQKPDTRAGNLLKAAHIKFCDSDLWKNIECYSGPGSYPYLECMHKATQRACRIIMSESALVLTDMLRECMGKSALVKSFCLMVRFWLSVHELKIKDFEYGLISLMVFFLISINAVALSEEKYKSGAETRFYLLSKEQVEVFPGSSSNQKPVVGVMELFQKFLLFMNSFDFNKYAICLPLRCPIPKSEFSQNAFKHLLGTQNIDSIKSSLMCIVDPISCANLAAGIDRQHQKEFLKIVGATVKHYKIK